MTSAGGGGLSEVDRLILVAATGGRQLSEDEIGHVLEHVAQAGFDPHGRQRVAGQLTSVEWQGRILGRGDLLPTVEAHYLKHVVVEGEWPEGTTLDQYIQSLRDVILDPTSGLLVSRFQDKGWQLAVVRRSEGLRGPEGHEWLLVEYRVGTGCWMTAFQLEKGLAYFDDPARREHVWLRKPQ